MPDHNRVPCAWLPIASDWPAMLAGHGACTETAISEHATARWKLVGMLDAVSRTNGVQAVLIQTPLALAESVAAEIGERLNTEQGRAAVAAALVPRYWPPTKKVLGLEVEADSVGWCLIDDPAPIEGTEVYEMIITKRG